MKIFLYNEHAIKNIPGRPRADTATIPMRGWHRHMAPNESCGMAVPSAWATAMGMPDPPQAFFVHIRGKMKPKEVTKIRMLAHFFLRVCLETTC